MRKNECTEIMKGDADKNKLPIWGVRLSVIVSLAYAIKYQDWHFIFVAIFAIGMLYLERNKNISNYFLLSLTLLVYFSFLLMKSIMVSHVSTLLWVYCVAVALYIIKYTLQKWQK